MANQQQLALLKQGVETWNQWIRKRPSGVKADLSRANLEGVDLNFVELYFTNLAKAQLQHATLRRARFDGADLSGADLNGANLQKATFVYTNLSGANLSGADLNGADIGYTNLSGANLSGANLNGANLSGADLSGADLSGANLSSAILVQTHLGKATLTNCRVYGISAWDVDLAEANQSSLIITALGEPIIAVDNLKVAQFTHLLLNNKEIRDVINTIGQKGVLILDRFSLERKLVLDALREKLRTLQFLPIIFDFDRPTERDFTETIKILAGLSCFIIADITNPKSSPLELQATVPDYMIPFVPLIQKGEQPFSMFKDIKNKYNWVLDPLAYDTPSNLIKVLEIAVVKPALDKRAELLAKKVEQLRVRDIEEFISKISE